MGFLLPGLTKTILKPLDSIVFFYFPVFVKSGLLKSGSTLHLF